MKRFSTNQKGAVPILVLVAVIGLIGFLVLSSIGSFKNNLFSSLFPKTSSQAAVGDSLSVNASVPINPFSKQMLGVGMVNWEHTPVWGSKFSGDVPNLSQAMKEGGVGLIRYAGGLWANYVGWDRTPQKTPYVNWVKNGNTYSFHYGTDEMDSLNRLADSVGADVMIQVNIAVNDPAMWADMVRYVNIEKGYNFKYWEFGNELDVDSGLGITPDIYAARVKTYIDAMKDVDPNIKIIVAVPGSAHDAPRQGYSDAVTEMSQYLSKSAVAVSAKGRIADDLSWHWYQACNNSGIADLTRWNWPGLATNSWRNSYSRVWSQIAPQRIQSEIIGTNPTMRQGITELNFDACAYDHVLNGNHLSALWASDVLGRLAYNGLDFSTWYEGYGGQGYSLIYPDNSTPPTKMFVRPSYYAFYMFNKYFGDQMVQSSSTKDSDISIWASTDSKDPGKLKLRITNITAAPITIPINLTGFNTSGGSVYTLTSTNPTDISATSNTQNASTSINGIKLDGNSVATSALAITPVALAVSGSSFNYTFPAYSSTAIVLSSAASPSPSASALPTPSPSPSPSLTPTPSPLPSPTPFPGDIDGNKKVDIFDYNILLGNFGKTGVGIQGDIDGNNKVDIFDYNILLGNFGKTSP